MLFSGVAKSDEDIDQSVDKQEQKKGNTIWLEEKISPTTTWVENLVKPLTVLIERQINKPATTLDDQESNQLIEKETILEPDKTSSDEKIEANSLISSEQARELAKNHIAGDVLYIKLLSKTNQYRVKLISKLGEIHIIYIRATSGEVILPNAKNDTGSVKQSSAEQNNTINSVPGSDGQKGEKL